jgi:hypothetical protein
MSGGKRAGAGMKVGMAGIFVLDESRNLVTLLQHVS